MSEIMEDRSISDLFAEFSDQAKRMLRDEFELMRLEMSLKAAGAGRHLSLIAAGGVVLFAGFLTLIGAVVWLLALMLPLWLSAVIVGAVVSGAGAIMIRTNLGALRRRDYKPNRTLRSFQKLKEEGSWLKKQM